jgi:N-acyl-L-homoserine lactone synthetase
MIDAITFETAHLLGDALPSMYRLRHRVFVERKNYEVPNYRGMEWDQFDTPAAVYLLWRDENHQVRGMMRLIPTTFPYMIKELWPDLVDSGEFPSRPDVWEITRFGVDRDLEPEMRKRACSELVAALFEYGLAAGIRQYLCLTMLPILRNAVGKAGCTVDLLGAPQKLGGLPVVAGKFGVSRNALAKIRRHHGIGESILRIAGERQAQAA